MTRAPQTDTGQNKHRLRVKRDSRTYRIRNVRLLDPATSTDEITDVVVQAGRILAADTATHEVEAGTEIDGGGLWLMPSIVDLCARLREPGQTHKATMATETPAALYAGITELCLPPDTRPVIDNPAIVARVKLIAAAAGGAHVHVLGALTRELAGDALAEMSALKQAGCVGVSNAGHPLADLRTLRRALAYASGLGLVVHVQAQEASLAQDGCAHDGPVALRMGLTPIPVAAESVALGQWLSLAEDTGARIHFGRISSARGVEIIATAKARGLKLSADVAAHQLFLCETDIEGFDPQCHVIPPLRGETDREALRAAVADGTLDAICSDHQPHEEDAKTDPFPLTAPGISALETLLPLGLRLVEQKILTPLQLAERVGLAPRRILGAAATTDETAGYILVDPAARWQLSPDNLHSRGHNTPFMGEVMPGRVQHVFIAPGTGA